MKWFVLCSRDLICQKSPTPLNAAIKEGYEHIAELLLSHKAVNRTSKILSNVSLSQQLAHTTKAKS